MKTPLHVERVNANDDEVELLRRTVAGGAAVREGDVIGEVGTTKATVVLHAPATGFLAWAATEGAILPVGALVAEVHDNEGDARGAGGADQRQTAAAGEAAFRLSAGAAQLFEAAGVDPASLGARGLVTKADAERLLAGRSIERPDFIKRAEIRALERASSVLASSVSIVLPPGADVALPDLIVHAARGLARAPHLNSWFADGVLHRHERVDVGIAMDLGRGLHVVLIRDAASLTPDEARMQLEALTVRALEDALTPDDLAPATFTITDLSGLGVASFQPLIGERQSAILGLSGGPAAGTPYSLTLVFDHRASNGRTAAIFLADLSEALGCAIGAESPAATAVEFAQAPQAAAAPDGRCDRCAMGLADYYAKFPADGFMQMYMRADGSTGLMCHRCAGGFF